MRPWGRTLGSPRIDNKINHAMHWSRNLQKNPTVQVVTGAYILNTQSAIIYRIDRQDQAK